MVRCPLSLLFVSSIESISWLLLHMWSKFHICLANLCCNLWVLVLLFLMELSKFGQLLFQEILSASTNKNVIDFFLQYHILPRRNHFQYLQETKAGLKKCCSIYQVQEIKKGTHVTKPVKVFFDKYEDEAMFYTSQCELTVRSSMRQYSVAVWLMLSV